MKGKEESDLIDGDFGPAQSVAVFRRLFLTFASPYVATLLLYSGVFLSHPWIDS
jgi:hypothetical protein